MINFFGLIINILILVPHERPPLLKKTISVEKRGGLTRGSPLSMFIYFSAFFLGQHLITAVAELMYGFQTTSWYVRNRMNIYMHAS